VFLDRELERKAERQLSGENEALLERIAARMGKCFNVVPRCEIKSHFMPIDSRVLYSIMRETCPEFNVRMTEFTGENRETCWKNIFDFKRLKVSKQNVFTGMSETDGVAMCVHYRRLKTDRPFPTSASPVAKQEDEKEAGLSEQKVHESDSVVDADPGNTNVITIAVPKRVEDGADGKLRQKAMRLLRFSRARFYREVGIMNARKKIAAWNAGMMDHLEAMGEVTSRRADFQAFRKFMEVRIAHWDALWNEYTKLQWTRFVYEFVLWEAAGICQLFQSFERLEGG